MNDSEAIDAINAVLDRFFEGDLVALPYAALANIAQITGANKISHEESK
jgi:hypothetical protein